MDDALYRSVIEADDRDPIFSVWADHLINQGDPRGELVHLCDRLETDPTPELKRHFQELLGRHAEEWCPGFQSGAIELGWRHGFIDRLRVIEGEWIDENNQLEKPDATVIDLLKRPTADRIREIVLVASLM